jgi:hypothetical protein
MGSPEARQSFPSQAQRAAVAYSIAKQHKLASRLRRGRNQ